MAGWPVGSKIKLWPVIVRTVRLTCKHYLVLLPVTILLTVLWALQSLPLIQGSKDSLFWSVDPDNHLPAVAFPSELAAVASYLVIAAVMLVASAALFNATLKLACRDLHGIKTALFQDDTLIDPVIKTTIAFFWIQILTFGLVILGLIACLVPAPFVFALTMVALQVKIYEGYSVIDSMDMSFTLLKQNMCRLGLLVIAAVLIGLIVSVLPAGLFPNLIGDLLGHFLLANYAVLTAFFSACLYIEVRGYGKPATAPTA